MSGNLSEFADRLAKAENPEIRSVLLLINALCDEQNKVRPLLRNLERDVAKLRDAHADSDQRPTSPVGPFASATAALRLVQDTVAGCGEVKFSMAGDFLVRAFIKKGWYIGRGPTLLSAVGDLYSACAKAGIHVNGVTADPDPTMSA